MVKSSFTPVLTISLWVLVLVAGLIFIPRHTQYIYAHNDFFDYWIGSKLFWSHQNPYGITDQFKQLKQIHQLEFHWATGYSYPPIFAFIFYPFTTINPHLGSWVWFCLNLASYLLFIRFATRYTQSKYIFIYLLTFAPAVFSIAAGQVNPLLLWCFVPLIINSATKTVSIAIAVAGSIKLFPLSLIIPQTLSSGLKSGLVTLSFVCILWIAPLFHPQGQNLTTNYFFTTLPGLQQNFESYFTHQSLTATVARLNHNHQSLYIIVTLALIGYFLIRSTTRLKGAQIMLVWLTAATLLAGTNTFWNFLFTLIGQLWLVRHWENVDKPARIGFILSVVCSNLWWYLLYPISNLDWRPGFFKALVMSPGFIYGLIQLWLLSRKNYSKKS